MKPDQCSCLFVGGDLNGKVMDVKFPPNPVYQYVTYEPHKPMLAQSLTDKVKTKHYNMHTVFDSHTDCYYYVYVSATLTGELLEIMLDTICERIMDIIPGIPREDLENG